MKKAHRSLFFATLAFLTVAGCGPKALSPEDAFTLNQNLTLAIRGHVPGVPESDYRATGVYLGTNGLVLTNQHVAQPAELASLEPEIVVCLVHDGAAQPCLVAKVVAVSDDPNVDLALLQANLPDIHPIMIRNGAAPLAEAEQVYSRLSYGVYLPPSLAYGRFLGRNDDMGLDVYDLADMLGSSGGPIFDLRGRLVGLAMGVTATPGRSLAIAVPSTAIIRFLAAHGDLFEKKR